MREDEEAVRLREGMAGDGRPDDNGESSSSIHKYIGCFRDGGKLGP